MLKLDINSLPDTNLDDVWVDRDDVLLHASFQVLTDFVEQEDGIKQWSHESHMTECSELEFLYNWWQNRKMNEPQLSPSPQYDEDNEMLIRLIKIRKCLWT